MQTELINKITNEQKDKALGTYLVVGSMNLDNGPNFALAYLVPVYSLGFESAKSQGNAIFMKIRPQCASLLKTKS